MIGLFESETPDAAERALYEEIRREGVLPDPENESEGELLRREVARIAADMDADDRPPPMLWSGVPWPEKSGPLRAPPCLSLSVGGTKTEFIVLELTSDGPVAIAGHGRIDDPQAIAELKRRLAVPTPTHDDTPSGHAMVRRIVGEVSARLEKERIPYGSVRHLLLSWGFANRAVRTAPQVLGGLTARALEMSKDQARFTADLRGQDVGALFREGFEESLGHTFEVTVANDGIMALHYFLGPANRRRYGRIGLAINGTGTNFALAEDYAVRAEGVVSRPGESYEPERIRPARPLREGEHLERYFVNYEAGSIELGETRTRYDTIEEFQIESNVIAGGCALGRMFRLLVENHLGSGVYGRLSEALCMRGGEEIGGREVAALAGGAAHVRAHFPCALQACGDELRLGALIARIVLARSALHLAMILAAVTRRVGFGLGDGARPDLLGLEGSVWKSPRYPELVRGYWSALVAPNQLRVVFDHEPGFDASLPGPLYLAALHD